LGRGVVAAETEYEGNGEADRRAKNQDTRKKIKD